MDGNVEIREIMKLLHPLSVNSKLEIISKLTEELKADLPLETERKKKLLNELYGSWSDVKDKVVEEIISSRFAS